MFLRDVKQTRNSPRQPRDVSFPLPAGNNTGDGARPLSAPDILPSLCHPRAYRNRLVLLAPCSLDLPHRTLAPENLSKNHVFAVQVGRWGSRDEELGTVGVCSTVRHRQQEGTIVLKEGSVNTKQDQKRRRSTPNHPESVVSEKREI